MSETTTVPPKPARTASPLAATSAAAQPAAKAPEQTLRATKPKCFAPSSLKPLGYGETEIMTLTVPEGWRFDEVMKSVAWVSVVGPIAANAIKTQIDRIGSLIYVNTADNRFMAWLRITRIVRDELKNACGLEALCIGPAIDLKTGRPCPMDLKTGLAWVDPELPKEAAAA
jgi:hypothetical protein